ncbi:MAG: hypothetical protein F6J94_01260 [Moorea sp. SIO1F2]|nr:MULTISPECIES: hypothetical protein [unclassified Moorena]NEO63387.1 hypothetical protein [Moorena sp. SIO4G2]NEQ84665.1 hypothetical protein [Moorena sp. SIO2I5]NET80661.1 hypothetical protein [Moorena sp. SIO1F2]NEO10011.1 hypothetical protein [Moorena sp. SIO3I8]NEO20507.1 hypothetical protein [Moorena sp. SIO4A5]
MIGFGVLDFYVTCHYPPFQVNQDLGKIGQPTRDKVLHVGWAVAQTD